MLLGQWGKNSTYYLSYHASQNHSVIMTEELRLQRTIDDIVYQLQYTNINSEESIHANFGRDTVCITCIYESNLIFAHVIFPSSRLC